MSEGIIQAPTPEDPREMYLNSPSLSIDSKSPKSVNKQYFSVQTKESGQKINIKTTLSCESESKAIKLRLASMSYISDEEVQ